MPMKDIILKPPYSSQNLLKLTIYRQENLFFKKVRDIGSLTWMSWLEIWAQGPSNYYKTGP